MTEKKKQETNHHKEQASLDTTANVLQATFIHYFQMALHHHTKASTTSNFLLIIIGAILSFVSFDKTDGGTINIISGLTIFVLGLFGVIWTWKQHERYYYWQHIAHEYQKELIKIVPGLEYEITYRDGAKGAATEKYTSLFAVIIHERWLWVSIHSLVAAIGLGLAMLVTANMI